jgi:SAM-dependent methyltransferase
MPDPTTVDIEADGSVHADVLAEFKRYVLSHPDDARRSLGVADQGRLVIRISGTANAPKTERNGDTVTLTLSPRVTELIPSVGYVRGLAHGALMVPTVSVLWDAGAFEPLIEKSSRTVPLAAIERSIEGCSRKKVNVGYLHGALRLFALQGWIERSGRDLTMTLTPTRVGREAFELLRIHAELYRRASAAIARTQEYYRGFRDAAVEATVVDEYRDLADRSMAHWHIRATGSDKYARRAATQLRTHLDGSVLLPTFIALTVPRFSDESDRIVEADAGFLQKFVSEHAFDLEAAAAAGWHRSMLEIAVGLLAHHGLMTRIGSSVQLTPLGRARLQVNAASFSVSAGSYLRAYAHADRIFFGDQAAQDAWVHEESIDRRLNNWSIANTTSIARARDLCDKIVRQIFDDRPLDEQPAGIADMGCGDGRPLREIVQYVIEKTARGRALDRYPLGVIAADISEIARARARETLKQFEAKPGVRLAVIEGDVTDPQGYDATIRALAWRGSDGTILGAGSFMHMLFHLVHDRTLRVATESEAEGILRNALRKVDRATLADALAMSVGRPVDLPADDDALLRLVSEQFTTSYAYKGRFISSIVAAADLVAFLERWTKYVGRGLAVLDPHTPRPEALLQDVPDDEDQWMRFQKIGHTSWSTHYVTDQYLTPYVEHQLGCVLAGLKPVSDFGGGYFTLQVPIFRDRSMAFFLPA